MPLPEAEGGPRDTVEEPRVGGSWFRDTGEGAQGMGRLRGQRTLKETCLLSCGHRCGAEESLMLWPKGQGPFAASMGPSMREGGTGGSRLLHLFGGLTGTVRPRLCGCTLPGVALRAVDGVALADFPEEIADSHLGASSQATESGRPEEPLCSFLWPALPRVPGTLFRSPSTVSVPSPLQGDTQSTGAEAGFV